MVQITVDTQKDSAATLRRLISFLEEELRMRGESPITPLTVPPVQPMMDNNPFSVPNSSSVPTTQTSTPSSSDNSFSDMFGASAPAPAQSEPAQVASTPDMFSAFSHDAPTQAPVQTPQDSSSESYISSHMTQPGQSTPSASQLLEEDNIHDITEDLAQQVWQQGSTRKRDPSLDLEPY